MATLKDINPCGYEELQSTQCKYVPQCVELGETSGEFVCLSKMAYQVAGYLIKGSDIKTERNDLRGFIISSLSKRVVDPEKERWAPKPLGENEVDEIVNKIILRGEGYSKKVSQSYSLIRGNHLDFNCSTKDIIRDLF